MSSTSWKDDINGNLTPEQKQQAMHEAQQKREGIIATGKAIVYFIAIFNIAFSALDLIVGASGIVSLVIQIALSVALMSGRNWARILFIIGMALSAIVSLYALLSYSHTTTQNFLLFILVIFNVLGTVFLFVSKSVSEFMYFAKNG